MKLELEKQLPDGYELAGETHESITLDSDKSHVIVRYSVKPIDNNPHAELKAQYKRDVETCASIDGLDPWQLWKIKSKEQTNWSNMFHSITFCHDYDYRRHLHADSMIAYHKCSPNDKKRWQYQYRDAWLDCDGEPDWDEHTPAFRIKPRKISVTLQNGDVIEFPEPVREPLNDETPYFIIEDDGVNKYEWHDHEIELMWLKQGRIFLSESECQAAHDAIQAILSQRSG